MSPLELAANVVTTVSIVLAGRNSIHTWWTGILGAVLFGLLFYESQLYADVTLQIFFVGTSIAGWLSWQGGGQPLAITHATPRVLGWTAVGGVAAAIGYGTILHVYTDAYAPFWDSLVLVGSVVAQLLLIHRKIETWYVWLMVNTVSVPLYCSRGLWLTGALYAAYWINALIAARRWQRDIA